MVRKVVPPKSNSMMRYVLIFALVLLLGFAVMYVYNIQKATKEKFESQSKFTVTYIYKEGCPWCVKMSPVWDSWVSNNKDKYIAKKLEASKAQSEINKYNITGYPIVIIENDKGNLISKKIGYSDYRDFDTFVANLTA